MDFDQSIKDIKELIELNKKINDILGILFVLNMLNVLFLRKFLLKLFDKSNFIFNVI